MFMHFIQIETSDDEECGCWYLVTYFTSDIHDDQSAIDVNLNDLFHSYTCLKCGVHYSLMESHGCLLIQLHAYIERERERH